MSKKTKRQSPTTPQPNQRLSKTPAAYVFFNTKIGAKKEVAELSKGIEGVGAAYSLWGVYDVIANIEETPWTNLQK